MNIIHTYIDMLNSKSEKPVPKAQVARFLGKKFQRKYSSQKLNAWLSGIEPVPKHIYDYLLQACLPYVVSQITGTALSDELIEGIRQRISRPEPKKAETFEKIA